MSSKHYILNVILSIFAVFLISASWICTAVIGTVGRYGCYEKVVEKNNIYSYAQESIEKSFEEYSHTSGIEKETFSAYYDENFIKENINSNIKNFLDVLLGKKENYDYISSVNFSNTDETIDTFFNDYAEKTDYVKDEIYEEKLNETKEKAHEVFTDKTDVFRFSLMNENGIIQKISSKISLIKGMFASCYILAVIFILLIIIINRKENLYWLGCPFFVSGLLLLIPLIYIKASGFINGFTVKEKPVFYSITGLLDSVLNNAIAFALVSIIFGLVFLFLGIFLKSKKKEEK